MAFHVYNRKAMQIITTIKQSKYNETTEYEYDAYEIHLYGKQESLEEMKQLVESMEKEDGLVRSSDLMREVGVEPDADADNIWWETEGVDFDDDDELYLTIYEYTQKDFDQNRIISILRTLKNPKGLTSIEWEKIWLLNLD